ncbi:MAG TPA: long-chain fatty acid--CoA ligase [Candidatus Sulfotelmatobacter sp.]|nr:long-chain fatty acid--CoA ligase [Candidatus Sulfotelmatobacter sp.]
MQTLPRYLAEHLRAPRERAFAERLGAPEWRFTSSTRMLERARAIACALREAGAQAGDRVVLMANNRVDWIAADFGILFAGCVPVPTYATIALDQLDYILADSEAKLLFVESAAQAQRVRAACPHAPRIVAFDDPGPDGLGAFEAVGAARAAADPAAALRLADGVQPGEVAVLIYTSGTTGNPKGVMLTHDNLLSNATSSYDYGLQGVETAGEIVLSVLPYAHIYEHTGLLGYFHVGYDVYVTQPDFLLADLQASHPFAISLVPRIYERILTGIRAGAAAQGGEAAVMVPKALEIARAYAAELHAGRTPSAELTQQHAAVSAMVFPAIKERLGLDRLRYFVSGSAPLHLDVALTFAGMGLPIGEGYGLTETSPTITAQRVQDVRYGTVGRPIPGMEIRIADDGEILVRGAGVMKGYYRSAEGFTSDGWFQTGDIGQLDGDGFLTITDRKKELIKTSGGKYVAPSRVEAAARRSPYVGQCLVLGDGHPFPIALVAPEWAAVRARFGIAPDVPTAEIAARDDVHAFVQNEVAAMTAELATFEQIRRVALLPRDLTIEDGDLSPAMKVRRRVVEQRFADLIARAYAAPANAAAQVTSA